MSEMFPVDEGVNFGAYVLAIIIGRNGPDGFLPVSFEGTGFVIAPGLLVTCWHCVRTPPPANHLYAVIVERDDGMGYRGVFLTHISQHPAGLDLAIARIDHRPAEFFSLADKGLQAGTRVFSWGYPLSRVRRLPDGGTTFMLEPRHLEGYVIRPFRDEDRGCGITEAYELDMPTPEGLSGAPLIRMRSREVVGVVYGTNEVALIKQFERVDEDGRREPEIHRVVSFGLAHSTSSLHSLSGPATEGIPLGQYMQNKR
jgi:hypothetical protein